MKRKDTTFEWAENGSINNLTKPAQEIGYIPNTQANADDVNFKLNDLDDFANDTNNELFNLLDEADIIPDENDATQVTQAVKKLGSKEPVRRIGGVLSYNTSTVIDISAVRIRSSDDTVDINISSGSLDITNSSDWASGVAPTLGGYFLPIMTSGVQDGFTITASVDSSNSYKVADRDDSTGFSSGGVHTGNETLTFQKDTGFVNIKEIGFRRNNSGSSPINGFDVYSSNDGISYSLEQSFTIGSPTTSYNTVTLTNPINSNYIQIRNFNYVSGSAFFEVNTFDLLQTNEFQNLSVFIWADYNSDSPRHILDDSTGSNISGEKAITGAVRLNSSGDLRDFYCTEKSGGALVFEYISLPIEYSSALSDNLYELSIPVGLELEVEVSANAGTGSTTSDATVSGGSYYSGNANIIVANASANVNFESISNTESFISNTDGEIYIDIDKPSGTTTSLSTRGYRIERG